MNMGQTPPASRCLQFDTGPKTDIHPYSHRALCKAQGTCCVKNTIWYLQKNICKWRPFGLSMLLFPTLPSLGGGLGMQTRRDKCQEMYAPDAWPGLLLSHPFSQHVRSATLNHSTRDKLTAPSLTATEMKFQRTLMTESALKTLSHI